MNDQQMRARTPEEIKAGLVCHTTYMNCRQNCPYEIESTKFSSECIQKLTKDALTLITQLETERDALKKKIDDRDTLLNVLGVSVPERQGNETTHEKA